MHALVILGWILGGSCAAFGALFLIARRIGNFGIVDVLWSAGFAPSALACGLLADGAPLRRCLATLMAVLWSARLATHLGRRVLGHLDKEDGRYQALRLEWRGALDLRMALFFQAQAASLALLSAPFLIADLNGSPRIHPLELAAILLWAVALAGETLSDRQLAAFKADPANRGRVCATGLWAWSRHPNYFFEWLTWVAFALFALPSPGGWAALACPAIMLLLLLRVTGVRYTEEQLLRSKGAAYLEYSGRTSAFIPWPPRRSPSRP
jgi:steroid 5-alpha reductase family enzyme